MDERIQAELSRLLSYVQGVAKHAQQRPDAVYGAYGYVGGALTTLFHLNLISGDEYREWSARLISELPPIPGDTFG